MDVTAGQLAVMKHEQSGVEQAIVVSISEVDETSKALQILNLSGQHDWRDWIKGDTALLLGPNKVRVARLNGPDVVHCDESHGLAIGDGRAAARWVLSVRRFFDVALQLSLP